MTSGKSVVIGEPEEPPTQPRPRFLVLATLLVSIIVVGLVLAGSEFMSSEDVLIRTNPGLATVDSFWNAISDGDAPAAAGFLDPDFVVLQLPDPLNRDYRTTFNPTDEGARPVEGLSSYLAALVALGSKVSVSDCHDESPDSTGALALYDRVVDCTVQWQDELRNKLSAQPIGMTMKAGVRDGLIRSLFLSAERPENAGPDPVFDDFLPWFSQHHPAACAGLIAGPSLSAMRQPAGPHELMSFSEEYHHGLETRGTPDARAASAPPPRTGHFLVFRSSTKQVLLIGGATGDSRTSGGCTWAQEVHTNDVWRLDGRELVWKPVKTDAFTPEIVIEAAVRHPATDQILTIGWNSSTFIAAVRQLNPDSTEWTSATSPQTLWYPHPYTAHSLADPVSSRFLVFYNNAAWFYDPSSNSWTDAPEKHHEFEVFVRSLQVGRYPEFFATAMSADSLVGAGAGQVRSMVWPGGPTNVHTTNGPRDVSDMVFVAESNVMIIIGDGAIWSHDLEDNALERLMDVPAGGVDPEMFWRTAAATYDESAGVVVIFDGEQTWTFDIQSTALTYHPTPTP